MTIAELVAANLSRVKRWHPNGLSDWSPLEWAGAMAGEAGEACNAAKKLKRIDDQIANINSEPGRSLTERQVATKQIAKEVADTIIYGALLVSAVEEDLTAALIEVFNKKSEEYGFPERLGAELASLRAQPDMVLRLRVAATAVEQPVCNYIPISSRVCELGRSCCTVKHASAPLGPDQEPGANTVTACGLTVSELHKAVADLDAPEHKHSYGWHSGQCRCGEKREPCCPKCRRGEPCGALGPDPEQTP